MPGDDGKLGGDEVTKFPYGDLNPVFVNQTKVGADPSGASPMAQMRKAAQAALTGDSRSGTGPYKGVVLRKNKDITSAQDTPVDSWLASFFGSAGEDSTEEQIPYTLQSYQVMIPELHATLPRVSKYLPYDVQDEEHTKIDRYPAFIARDSNVDEAKEGDLVWVDFGNSQTFEDPVYLGPVFPKPDKQQSGSRGGSAQDAMNNPCGGSGNSGGGPTTSPGEGLGYMEQYQQQALRNASGTYKEFQNIAYAPTATQKQCCHADPARNQSEEYWARKKQCQQLSSEAEREQCFDTLNEQKRQLCIRCYVTHPFPTVGKEQADGLPHSYSSGFLQYMQSGGRGKSVSGRVGPGSCSQLPTQIERILMAQRIVVEDQAGRGYGWGGKSWVWTRAGIDCSGFSFLLRCMVEVMISKDLTKLDGYNNVRFKGYHGKGCPDGTHESSIPSDARNIDVHWARLCYGNIHRPWVDKGWCKSGDCESHGGSYTTNGAANYRRGLWDCVAILENQNGDPNTMWNGQYPLMPGDEIFSGGRRSGNNRIFYPRNDPRSGGTNVKDIGFTHVQTAFCGPDGELRVAESGGPFGGVGARLAGEWASANRNAQKAAFMPEEMRRAWAECKPALDSAGIKNHNGRPMEPWTPEIAKIVAPTLFGKLPEMGELDQLAAGEKTIEEHENNPPPPEGTTEDGTRQTGQSPTAGSERIDPEPPKTDQAETESDASSAPKTEDASCEKLRTLETNLKAAQEKYQKIRLGLGKISSTLGINAQLVSFDETDQAKSGLWQLRDAAYDATPEVEQSENTWSFVWKTGVLELDDEYTNTDGNRVEFESPDIPRLHEDMIFGTEEEAQEAAKESGLIFATKLKDVRGEEKETLEIRKELISYYEDVAEDVADWLKDVQEQLTNADKNCNPNPPEATGQTGSGSSGSGCSGTGGSGGGGGGGGGGVTVDNGQNPNYVGAGEEMPLSQPKAKKVKIYFDQARYDHCGVGITTSTKSYASGYKTGYLREDAANDLAGVKDVANNLGAVILSSGTGRSLGNYDPSKTNRSTTSFHYTNLAMDLFIWASSLYPRSNPQECEYVVTKSSEVGSGNRYYFDIWARSDKPAGTEYKGFKVQRVTLDALVCKARGPATTVQVTGNYINLWEIYKSYGFHRIVGRSGWYTNCKSGAASEWWHMQSHNKTYQGRTTWEEVLKSVNDDRKVECSPVYKHRNRVFRGKGFTNSRKDTSWSPC